MSENSTKSIGICPQCRTNVDPLRAGAVSIAEGQIVHYCSAACRDLHLRRNTVDKVVGSSVSEEALPDSLKQAPEPESPSESQVYNETKPPRKGRAEASLLFRFARPIIVEILGLSFFLAGIFLLSAGALNGYLHLILAAGGAVFAFATGVLRERGRGVARILEASAVPMAALALTGAGYWGYPQKTAVLSAVILLILERLGRLFEVAGRQRSGVLEVISGGNESLLASEWRDNSTITARLRRVTIVLEWARIPLAVAGGMWFLIIGHFAVSDALIVVAALLLALNPRSLRMATGDAYLATALNLAKDGIVVRDAHAVNRVGVSRVALFMARRVLLAPNIKIMDWKMVSEIDEGRVISALWALESLASGRIAEAVRGFIENKSGIGPESIKAEVVPGKGLKGSTSLGRVLCGSRELLLQETISTATHEAWAGAVEQSGRRAFFVAMDGQVAAVFTLEEEPLPNVQETTRGLSLLGMETSMVTSAEVKSALALGARLGVENVKFGILEKDLGKTLADMNSSGENVLLIGHGTEFEESLRLATASVCIRSDDDSQAGVHARMLGTESLIKITSSSRSTLRSVKVNVATAFIVVMLSLGLAWGWHYAAISILIRALGSFSCAFCTFNAPYPLLQKVMIKFKQLYSKFLKVVGMERGASA